MEAVMKEFSDNGLRHERVKTQFYINHASHLNSYIVVNQRLF